MSGPTQLLANLACEHDWAGDRRPLPRALRRRLALLGTTLRVLGQEGESLHLAAAVDPGLVPTLPGVPVLRPTADPVRPDRPCVPWGRTERLPPPPPPPDTRHDQAAPGDAARWNHDGGLDVLREAGCLPPDPQRHWLQDHAALHAWRDALPSGTWLVGAPWAAAGRHRVRIAAQPSPTSGTWARVARWIQEQGAVHVEPWRARQADLGATVWLADPGPGPVQVHRNRVDVAGVFRGVAEGPADAWTEALTRMTRHVATHLHQAGVRGPVGIDAYVARREGEPSLHVCDLNVRYTFGWILRQAAARIRAATSGSGPDHWALNEGTPPPDAWHHTLLRGSPDHPGLWLGDANPHA